MQRTWTDAGFDELSLDDTRYSARARLDYQLGDIDVDPYDQSSVHAIGRATRGATVPRTDAADGDVQLERPDEPDADQCYDEMVRYVKATTGLKANTARVMPPKIAWEDIMKEPFTLDRKFSLMSEENHAVLTSKKWRPFYMEVESVLRPMLLTTTLDPVYDRRAGCKLSEKGLAHADSGNFSIDDHVYTSNVFHMDDRFFVSIIVLESAGSSHIGHIKAYFYIHSDKDNKPAAGK